MLMHIIIKQLKSEEKEKSWKQIENNWHIAYRRTTIEMTADYSWETRESRMKYNNILTKCRKKTNVKLLLYSSENILQEWVEIRTLLGKRELKEFIAANLIWKNFQESSSGREKQYQKKTWNVKNEKREIEMVNFWVNIID